MLENAEYLYPGIIVYRDVFKKEMNIIDRLENNLLSSDVENRWSVAITGYSIKDKTYRDCFDYKIKKNDEDDSKKTKNRLELEKLWQECKDAQVGPINDYRSMFGVAPLNYWEASNFIKYGKDQHFQVHSDHGYSYIAVLSAVGYINDDYEGGELYFDKFNLTIKPKAGDLYLFPSAFVYSHAAMPVQSGTKYSIVTMLDYFEAAHTPEYREIEKKYAKSYSLG